MKRYDVGRPVAVGIADKQCAALSFAAEEARLTGCDLRVVHAFVVPPGPPDRVSAVYGVDIAGSFREAGQEVLAQAMSWLAVEYADVVIHPVLDEGPAPLVLGRVSETSRLLVVGPDDAAPWFTRLFQSKVSRALARKASCPVVVVPDSWEPGRRGLGVTLLVDNRTVAAGPLRYAFEHAARHVETLSIVRVGDDQDDAGAVDPNHDADRLVDAWRAMHPHVQVSSTVAAATADAAAVEAFGHTSLLVTGGPSDHHATGLRHGLLARAVIERAACPLAVVPPGYDG